MALLHVNFYSDLLELACSMDVILPETVSPRPDGKWPALYLLHGLSDDHTIWQRRTSIERHVAGRNLAVIMPTVQRGFYTDMRHGAPYWTFISEELPALCERLFPIAPERGARFAAGLSMGGYGAFKLGLRRPDRYAAVASLSGVVDVVQSIETLHRHSDAFYADIFGPLETLRGSDNDLCAVASRLIASGAPRPRFYQSCGTEDFLYPINVDFYRRFGRALDITWEDGPGTHSWALWDAYIQRVLDWMGF